jgi:hypothetical protein
MLIPAVAVDLPPSDPNRYNVVWETPSGDSSGSMPIGNGDIGLNVWTEANGDLVFYLAKSDAWSENCRLLKLGRVRISMDPGPFAAGAPFKQTLHLDTGEITIDAGPDDQQVSLRIWVDANHPVVHVRGRSASPVHLRVRLETWRERRRQLGGEELHSAYGQDGENPHPVFVEPDTIVPAGADRITWYHRNERSIWADNLERQALGHLTETMKDPLLGRTFGASIEGTGLRCVNPSSLESTAPARAFDVSVYPMTRQTETAAEWLTQLDQQVDRLSRLDPADSVAAHRRWWSSFWRRSWIHVTGFREAFSISQGYALQRYISASAGRGAHPIKFNGSLFTVDARESPRFYDADFRRWGGAYWWQNTRLAYWPMLAAGDFELMQPLFRMYADALPLARARTRIYYGHDGVFFPETIYFWGTYVDKNYGWHRDGMPDGLTENRYIRYYWQGGLELAALMLDYYDFTRDERFLGEVLMPLADGVLTFYAQHYPRDAEGRIRFEPAQALETYWDVPNPAPPIAGLRFVIRRLLDRLPAGVAPARRSEWQRLLDALPPLPTREVDGQTVLAPAELLINKHNQENPELYAVFPYALFGVGRDGIELVRRTFAHRVHKGTGGWQQDAIQAACLGLADQAAKYVTVNFTTSHAGSRFPAFWGPNFDWVPDQDHGGVASIALQKMLMQNDGRRILLLPAWPTGWNVDFRLHAPDQSAVQGMYTDGALQALIVTPASRANDVTRLSTPQR